MIILFQISQYILSTKYRLVVFLASYLITNALHSQSSGPFMVDDISFQHFTIREFDASFKKENTSDRFICDPWCDNKIITLADTLEVKFNLDMSSYVYFINMNEKVFSVKSDFIKSFITDNKTFINYRKPNSTETMILELLVHGKYTLYKHHNLVYRAPDFDLVLNFGSKTGVYKMAYKYYAFCDSHLFEIPSKTKKAIKKVSEECSVPKRTKFKGELVDLFYFLNEAK